MAARSSVERAAGGCRGRSTRGDSGQRKCSCARERSRRGRNGAPSMEYVDGKPYISTLRQYRWEI